MIRRWRGLPGAAVILILYAMLLTMGTGVMFGMLMFRQSFEHQQEMLTRDGEVFFYDWRDQKRLYRADGSVLPDTAARQARSVALRLNGNPSTTYWEPDANRPGLRWRHAVERWHMLNYGSWSPPQRQKQWFFLPDERVLALYGEDGRLIGKLGPDGYAPGAETVRGFTTDLRPPGGGSEGVPFFLADTTMICLVSLDPPAVMDSRPAPAGVNGMIRFHHAFSNSEEVVRIWERPGWLTDSEIWIQLDAPAIDLGRIRLPDIWRGPERQKSHFQVWTAVAGGSRMRDTVAFTHHDTDGQRQIFADRVTGAVIIDTRIKQSAGAPFNSSRETVVFAISTTLFCLQPMPLPTIASVASYYILFGDVPETREERAALVLARPFGDFGWQFKLAALWLVLTHLFGAAAGYGLTRRLGAPPNGFWFWALVGIFVGAPVLLLLFFRGPRRQRGLPPVENVPDFAPLVEPG